MAKSPIIWTISSIRKALASGAVALLVAGCGVGGDLSSIYKVAQATFEPPASISYNEAASVPYASIGLRIGDSSQTMIILASDDDGDLMWTSAQRLVVVTRNGRIVRTAGFGHDLGGSRELKVTRTDERSYTTKWVADFPGTRPFAVPIVCEGRMKGQEIITLLGRNQSVRRFEEKCEAKSDDLDWTFKNVFWKDLKSEYVWKSIQHVNPKLDALEIETLRQPG